jgi:hypothetical protein
MLGYCEALQLCTAPSVLAMSARHESRTHGRST